MEDNKIGEAIVRLEEQIKAQTTLMQTIQKSLDDMKLNYDGSLRDIRNKIEERIKESDRNQDSQLARIVTLEGNWKVSVAVIGAASFVLQVYLSSR
jgi:uncharacterized protein Yka (UPF0111/DUF47 family)